MRLFRPGRIIGIVILALLVYGAWTGWKRLHEVSPASASAALADVKASGATSGGAPHAGVWAYRATGTEGVGAGTLNISRTLPATALLVVTAAGPDRADVGWRFSDDSATTWRIQHSAEGIVGVRRAVSAQVPLVGGTIGANLEISGDVQPAVLLVPANLPVGAHWSARYRANDLVFDRSSHVVSAPVVTIGGSSVATRFIRTTETVTGFVHGTIQEADWWDPVLGIPVKRSVDIQLSGAGSQHLKAVFTLKSLRPLAP